MRENLVKISDNIVKLGLILFIVSLPISVSGMSMFMGLSFLAWLMKFILDKERKILITSLDLPIIVFILVSILSSLLGIDPKNSFKEYGFLLPIIGYFVVVNNLKDLKLIKNLLFLLTIIASLNAIFGIFQHFYGVDYDIFRLQFDGVDRDPSSAKYLAQGTFSHHLTFSNVMLMVIFFSVSFMRVNNSSPKIKMLAGISFIIILLGILASLSRGPWIGFIIGVLFMGSMINKRAFLYILIGLIVFSISIIVFYPSIKMRAKSIFSITSNERRIDIWETSIKIIKDYPITGVGEGNYGQIAPKYWGNHNGHPSKSHAHNNILQVAVEKGILGLLVFIWLWILVFKKGIEYYLRIRMKNSIYSNLILCSLTSLVAFHVSGLTQYNFGDAEIEFLMWFVVGLMFVTIKMTIPESVEEKSK